MLRVSDHGQHGLGYGFRAKFRNSVTEGFVALKRRQRVEELQALRHFLRSGRIDITETPRQIALVLLIGITLSQYGSF